MFSRMLLMTLVLSCSMNGQDRSVMFAHHTGSGHMTGNLRVDFFGQRSLNKVLDEQETLPVTGQRKSPFLAAGLSLVVPGSGEFYAESYWKAAAFFALDVAAWALAYSFDKQGDRQTDYYQDFANQRWSVVRYGEYAYDHLLTTEQQAQYANWRVPGTDGRPPWEQVNWSVLNAMERAIGATEHGRYYSHTLAPFGDQQYYEMIGKYDQFNQGWDDAPPVFSFGDPVTPNFLFYSGERGKANTYYSRASTAVTIAIINHVLSALDAAWSASSYNSVHAQVGVQYVPRGPVLGQVTVVKLSYDF
jgi:hypothetical protein